MTLRMSLEEEAKDEGKEEENQEEEAEKLSPLDWTRHTVFLFYIRLESLSSRRYIFFKKKDDDEDEDEDKDEDEDDEYSTRLAYPIKRIYCNNR